MGGKEPIVGPHTPRRLGVPQAGPATAGYDHDPIQERQPAIPAERRQDEVA
jgi:hypothetical protein